MRITISDINMHDAEERGLAHHLRQELQSRADPFTIEIAGKTFKGLLCQGEMLPDRARFEIVRVVMANIENAPRHKTMDDCMEVIGRIEKLLNIGGEQ